MTRRRVRVLPTLCAAIALGWLSLFAAAPALAVDRGELTVSSQDRHIRAEYPPITTTDDTAWLCAQINPDFCTGFGGIYCDVVTLNVEVEQPYTGDPFAVTITLDWVPGTTNNNVLMYLWTEWDGVGCPDGVTDRSRPKSMSLIEPDPTQFYITIINRSGLNSGYTLSVDWDEIEFDFDLPDRRRSNDADAPFDPGARSGQRSDPVLVRPERLQPSTQAEDDQRTVLAPGPDGQLQEVTLPVIARGDREAAPPRRFDPVVASVVGVLLVSGGVLAFLATRRRRSEL